VIGFGCIVYLDAVVVDDQRIADEEMGDVLVEEGGPDHPLARQEFNLDTLAMRLHRCLVLARRGILQSPVMAIDKNNRKQLAKLFSVFPGGSPAAPGNLSSMSPTSSHSVSLPQLDEGKLQPKVSLRKRPAPPALSVATVTSRVLPRSPHKGLAPALPKSPVTPQTPQATQLLRDMWSNNRRMKTDDTMGDDNWQFHSSEEMEEEDAEDNRLLATMMIQPNRFSGDLLPSPVLCRNELRLALNQDADGEEEEGGEVEAEMDDRLIDTSILEFFSK